MVRSEWSYWSAPPTHDLLRMLYPFIFQPVLKENVWGGHLLEEVYGKKAPAGKTIGESWEITDRAEGVSVIVNGPLVGKDLRWLMENHAKEVLGSAASLNGRYPLLVKIIDARQKLSLQVHPPADKAAELGGEPKTEMWVVTQTAPGAELFVGLRRGMTRQDFENRLKDGTLETCFHRIAVKPGDAVFLPSGRVHALGAGVLIFEIQQNSNTTYRLFDWNRVGLDGKPRALHIKEGLACINFEDVEPKLLRPRSKMINGVKTFSLVDDPLFKVARVQLAAGQAVALPCEKSLILGVVEGRLKVQSNEGESLLTKGGFCLAPACLKTVTLTAAEPASFLMAEPG
jgi:mannose-6-phosphate isomerase